MNKDERLGDLLVQAGLLDELQLKAALGHQKRWGGKIGKCLVDLGFIEEETMLRFLSQRFNMKAVNLARSRIAPQTFATVPEKIAKQYQVVPVVVQGTGSKKTIVLAMSDPSNLGVIDEIQFLTGAKIEPVLATESAIAKVLQSYGDYTPEITPEYHFQETATPVQLKKEAQAREAAAQKRQVQQPAPPPKPAQKPDADDIRVTNDDDIEIIKGEVTMVKAMKTPLRKAGGETRAATDPGRPARVPEPGKRPGATPEKDSSPFLLKPGAKDEDEGLPEITPLTELEPLEEEGDAQPTPVISPQQPQPAPLIKEDTTQIQVPPIPGRAADSAKNANVPQSPPGIPDAPPPIGEGDWYVPPSEKDEALSDQKAELQMKGGIDAIDLPDEEPGEIQLADTHEFLPFAQTQESARSEPEPPAAPEPEAGEIPPPAAAPQPEQEMWEEDAGISPLPDQAVSDLQDDRATTQPESTPPPIPDTPATQPPSLDVPSLDLPSPATEAFEELGQPGQGSPSAGVEATSPEASEPPPEIPEEDFWGSPDKGDESPVSHEAPAPEGEDKDIWSTEPVGPEEPQEPELPDLPPLPDTPPDASLEGDEPEDHPQQGEPGPSPFEEWSMDEDSGDISSPDVDSSPPFSRDASQGIASLPFEAPPPDLSSKEGEKKDSDETAGQEQREFTPPPPVSGFDTFPDELPPPPSADGAGGEEGRDLFEEFDSAPPEPGGDLQSPFEPVPEQEDSTASTEPGDDSLRLPWEDETMTAPPEEPVVSPPADAKSAKKKLPWEDGSLPPPPPPPSEVETEPKALGELKKVAVPPGESPRLGITKEQISLLEDLGEEFLDIKSVKQRLSRISELEFDIKEKEFQFDELLSLMMKKELGDITQELFMKELKELKRKVDEKKKK